MNNFEVICECSFKLNFIYSERDFFNFLEWHDYLEYDSDIYYSITQYFKEYGMNKELIKEYVEHRLTKLLTRNYYVHNLNDMVNTIVNNIATELKEKGIKIND